MDREGGNIEVRASSIRIMFTLNGKQRKETLRLPPTPKNVQHARSLAARVKRAIANGTFDYAEFFPDSKHAAQESPTSALTLAQACKTYLQGCTRLAANTQGQYRRALAAWQRELGADTPVARIKHSSIAAAAGRLAKGDHGNSKARAARNERSGVKLVNNYLIPLRGVFNQVCRDLGIPDPVDGVKNSRLQPPGPDPLTRDELEQVLAHMREHFDKRITAYFEVMFFTGMRPEEAIALRWDDVDLERRVLHVRRAKTAGEVKALKTYHARHVDLVTRAVQALTVMQALSGAQEEVFQDPVTGVPWLDERRQRENYWKPVLQACGIRPRRAYQTRHTYATQALMAGANPAYIARQLGHSTAQMVFTVYARWLDGADQGREAAKIEAALSQNYPNS